MPTLLILAAGMSSRYGSPKQFDAVGPSGEALMDFAVHDAAASGATAVVMVSNPGLAERARSHAARWPLPSTIVIQDPAPTPARTKPRGTGEAILLGMQAARGPVVTINADDFYGADALDTALSHVRQHPDEHALVGFAASRTLSRSGGVSRGLVDADGRTVVQVSELKDVTQTESGLFGLDGHGQQTLIPLNARVSMNLWCFGQSFCGVLEAAVQAFTAEYGNDASRECYIGDVVNTFIASGKGTVHLLRTDADWFGMTFPDDRDHVRNSLATLTRGGHYPSPLFED